MGTVLSSALGFILGGLAALLLVALVGLAIIVVLNIAGGN